MDIAADFVSDTVAPRQPQPARGVDSTDAETSPTFEQHLEAETDEFAASEQQPAKPARTPKKPSSPDTETSEVAFAAGPIPVEQAAPPLLTSAFALLSAQSATPQAAQGEATTPATAQPAQQPHAASPDASAPLFAASAQPDASQASTTPAPAAPVVAPQTPQQAASVADAATEQSPTNLAPVSPLAALQVAPQPQQTNKAPAQRDGRVEDHTLEEKTQTTTPKAAKAIESMPLATFKAALRGATTEPPTKSNNAPIERAEASTSPTTTAFVTPTSSHHTASLEQIAQTQSARGAPAAHQVAQEIVRRFDGDSTQFDLRLDPPELGRVEVRLEVTRDHRVTAIVAADSPQALAELVRHARDLEQTLQSAGLQLSDNGLSFDLRQGGERSAEARNERGFDGGGFADDEAQTPTNASARPLGFERWRGVRVDITV